MNLIICIGNGDEKAATMSQTVSDNSPYDFRGFMDRYTPLKTGVYHTSIYDINIADLESKLKNHVVEIVMLDQAEHEYPSLYDFQETIKLGGHFSTLYPVTYQNPNMMPWIFEIQKNNTFCVMPFVSSHQNASGEISPCCYMKFDRKTVKKTRRDLQNLVLQGSTIPECQLCYDTEERGSSSPRTRWNQEYASLLRIKTKEDLLAANAVRFYHIEIDNQCNLLCRMCAPRWSNLIEKEYQNLGMHTGQPLTSRSHNVFKNVNLSTAKRILITGGEPTINDGLLTSLEQIVKDGFTDIEILISTNAVTVSKRLKKLIHQLPKLRFGVSIDGFDHINHYIRWPSDWKKINDNVKFFHRHERLSHFNTTISIFNIAHLYDLYRYIDACFPDVQCFMNFVSDPDHQTPWNHPNKAMIVDDLKQVTKLSLYQNKTHFKTLIDGVADKIERQVAVDHDLLRKFFHFNDVLDRSRGVRLQDYVPELAVYRENNAETLS